MDDKKVGLFIKELREGKSLSQQQLADELFVSRTLVTKWESGKISLTSTNLKSLCNFFNVSSDEMLVGTRKSKDNIDQIENAKYKLYDQNNLLKKKVKICFVFIISLIFLFFTYFFITFYSSVIVYTINVDNSNIAIKNGLLIKTRDKIYLKLEPKIINSNIKVEYLKLYYMVNNQEYEILKSSSFSTISINDFYEEQEYFDFDNFDNVKNNLYVEIMYGNEENEIIKLDLKKDYVNSKLFFKEKAKSNYTDKEETILENSIGDLIKQYNEKKLEINYEGINYIIIFLDPQIIISFCSNEIKESLIYNAFDDIYISKEVNGKNSYSYNVINKECIVGKCDNFKNDYELILDLLEIIKKSN